MSAERRKAWARKYISAAPDAPVYGSDAWAAMPDGPAKVAAVVKAAEAWISEGEEGLERLRIEHLAAALEAKQAADAEYAEHRDTWRDEWSRKSWRPHPVNRRTRYAERVAAHRERAT